MYYILVDEKRIITFRIESSLVARLDEFALTNGWTGAMAGLRGGDHKGKDTGRSALLVHLVEALVEGRVTIAPRASVNPFPADERLSGESPEFPALICLAPEPAKGWYVVERFGIGNYNNPPTTKEEP